MSLYLLTHPNSKSLAASGAFYFASSFKHSFQTLYSSVFHWNQLNKYYIIYKPFQVLSQFTSENSKACLKDFFEVPKDVYPVGRLDYDSEGLLLLTNDKSLNHRLLHPSFAHERGYRVQVEGLITNEALQQLSSGITIQVDGKPHRTAAAKASRLPDHIVIPDRNPPIRFR